MLDFSVWPSDGGWPNLASRIRLKRPFSQLPGVATAHSAEVVTFELPWFMKTLARPGNALPWPALPLG